MGEDNLESGMDALYLFFQISSTVGAGTVYPSGRKAAAVVAAVACVCAMISLLSGAGHWLASRRARRFAEVQLQTCSYLVMCLTGVQVLSEGGVRWYQWKGLTLLVRLVVLGYIGILIIRSLCPASGPCATPLRHVML